MGIGYACAEACLESGASIMVCARTEKPLTDAVASFRAKGYARISGYAADVSQHREVDALLEAFVKLYGGLDGVVHCAAIPGPIGPTIEVDTSEWFETIRVNLLCAFLIARQSSVLMRNNPGGGRIVLLSGSGASWPKHLDALEKTDVFTLRRIVPKDRGMDWQ